MESTTDNYFFRSGWIYIYSYILTNNEIFLSLQALKKQLDLKHEGCCAFHYLNDGLVLHLKSL